MSESTSAVSVEENRRKSDELFERMKRESGLVREVLDRDMGDVKGAIFWVKRDKQTRNV